MKNGSQNQKLARPTFACHDAFTLLELLVVISIISVLAALLMPALGRGKDEARQVACINNYKQLQLGWLLYTDDNDGVLPINDFNVPTTKAPGGVNWVGGSLMPCNEPFDQHDNTNTWLLLNVEGGIGCYVTDAKIFKCPSDRSIAKIQGQVYPRVRSCTMNANMNGRFKVSSSDRIASYGVISALAAFRPFETGFVLIDTHPDSIGSGVFLPSPLDEPLGWNSFPAMRHNQSSVLSFSDGHVNSHRWLDDRTRKPEIGKILQGELQPANPDIIWLQQRASAHKK